uniref:Carboxypeptidase n=1 Tax=Schistosoma japonicum TaxID=6182 RepID=C1LG90_SCHJA|nr:Lysosomal protective protein precursor [Schistosoma japonicum]
MGSFLAVLFALVGSLSGLVSNGTRSGDEIMYLPGAWPQPSFKQYSGYLHGSTDKVNIHYWLVEASSSPKQAPLVLWLNGGPECSSMEGLLNENGPYFLEEGPRLVENPYSWNKFANVLYFESPAGVGFSYSLDSNPLIDDNQTALDNYHALLHFLEKFPEYEGRRLFVTGESYAGVYVPTLSLLLVNSSRFDFKAIAVGNGLTNYRLNDNSLLYFINYHGLIGENSWNDLINKCCKDKCSTSCMFTDNDSLECQKIISELSDIPLRGLNRYNLYSECVGGVQTTFNHYSHHNHSSMLIPELSSILATSKQFIHHDFGNDFRDNIYVKYRRYANSLLRHNMTTRLAIPCVNDTLIRSYLNSPIVRRFINVKPDLPNEWDICSDTINANYVRIYRDLSEQYVKLLQSKIFVLLYNGDIDMACNYFGDELFVDNLKLEVLSPRLPWFYIEKDNTKQIGGYCKIFRLNEASLLYATVRGAGHMVPQDKPAAAFHLISRFVNFETPF